MKKYFYIYAYQYAYIYKSIVKNENHNFNFNGFLGDSDEYYMNERVSGKHIIYNGPEFSLAIPWKNSEDGIYFSRGNGGPGGSGWTLLCK